MNVWAFKAGAQLRETYEYATDVIQCKSAEQRICMRTDPRYRVRMDHVFDQQQYAAAKEMLRASISVMLPLWAYRVRKDSVQAGSYVILDIEATGSGFQDGGKAILWKSDTNYSVVDITIDSNGVVIDDLPKSYADVLIMPLYEAQAPDGISTSRPAGPYQDVSVNFYVPDFRVTEQSDFTQYCGHDVLSDCPIVAAGAIDSSLELSLNALDNNIGRPSYEKNREYARHDTGMRWSVQYRDRLFALREWVFSRRGRQRAFWFSSFAHDFVCKQAATPAMQLLDLENPYNIEGLSRQVFDLELTIGAQKIYRRVTASAIVSGKIRVLLDAPLGVTAAKIDRVSYLSLVRFSDDLIDFNHNAGGHVTCSIGLTEVPYFTD